MPANFPLPSSTHSWYTKVCRVDLSSGIGVRCLLIVRLWQKTFRGYLTLSLPRVINFKFLRQPHKYYYITQYEELIVCYKAKFFILCSVILLARLLGSWAFTFNVKPVQVLQHGNKLPGALGQRPAVPQNLGLNDVFVHFDFRFEIVHFLFIFPVVRVVGEQWPGAFVLQGKWQASFRGPVPTHPPPPPPRNGISPHLESGVGYRPWTQECGASSKAKFQSTPTFFGLWSILFIVHCDLSPLVVLFCCLFSIIGPYSDTTIPSSVVKLHVVSC